MANDTTKQQGEERTFGILKTVLEKIESHIEYAPLFKRRFGDLKTFNGIKKFYEKKTGNAMSISMRNYCDKLGIDEECVDLFDNYFKAEKTKFSKEEIKLFNNIGIVF